MMLSTSKPHGTRQCTQWTIILTGHVKRTTVEPIPRRLLAEEVRKLDGEYHIKIDPAVSPVQHPPRRVPVAVHEKLESELERMTAQNIIAPVTTPMSWVSSLVVVPKKDGKLRLCLDQGELVFKGKQLVVPASLCKELMAATHPIWVLRPVSGEHAIASIGHG